LFGEGVFSLLYLGGVKKRLSNVEGRKGLPCERREGRKKEESSTLEREKLARGDWIKVARRGEKKKNLVALDLLSRIRGEREKEVVSDLAKKVGAKGNKRSYTMCSLPKPLARADTEKFNREREKKNGGRKEGRGLFGGRESSWNASAAAWASARKFREKYPSNSFRCAPSSKLKGKKKGLRLKKKSNAGRRSRDQRLREKEERESTHRLVPRED